MQNEPCQFHILLSTGGNLIRKNTNGQKILCRVISREVHNGITEYRITAIKDSAKNNVCGCKNVEAS